MVSPIKDTGAMIANMSPHLHPGSFVFVTLPDPTPALLSHAVATYREPEGLSAILPVGIARTHGCDIGLPMSCITLRVYSALDGVGLTAAVATALAGADIPCNMVAAFHHDHAYVPTALAPQALAILEALSA